MQTIICIKNIFTRFSWDEKVGPDFFIWSQPFYIPAQLDKTMMWRWLSVYYMFVDMLVCDL